MCNFFDIWSYIYIYIATRGITRKNLIYCTDPTTKFLYSQTYSAKWCYFKYFKIVLQFYLYIIFFTRWSTPSTKGYTSDTRLYFIVFETIDYDRQWCQRRWIAKHFELLDDHAWGKWNSKDLKHSICNKNFNL